MAPAAREPGDAGHQVRLCAGSGEEPGGSQGPAGGGQQFLGDGYNSYGTIICAGHGLEKGTKPQSAVDPTRREIPIVFGKGILKFSIRPRLAR